LAQGPRLVRVYYFAQVGPSLPRSGVDAAMGTHKLFVGNLPSDVTQPEITAVFSTYGAPKDCHVMAGKSTSGQTCAFIVYDSMESAELAIASLDGKVAMREDGSSPMTVKWAKGSGPEATAAAAAAAVSLGAPAALGQQPQAAALLTSAVAGFSPGAVAGLGAGALAATAATAAPAPMGAQLALPGLDLASLQTVQNGLAGAVIGGGVVNAPPPPPLQMQQQKTKVFVGNLPPDITQEAVQFVFGNYGTVTNIHIMTGKSKSGQSCAFVEYISPLEAETAILTLNEKYEIRPGHGVILVKYANNQTGPGGVARMRPY